MPLVTYGGGGGGFLHHVFSTKFLSWQLEVLLNSSLFLILTCKNIFTPSSNELNERINREKFYQKLSQL